MTLLLIMTNRTSVQILLDLTENHLYLTSSQLISCRLLIYQVREYREYTFAVLHYSVEVLILYFYIDYRFTLVSCHSPEEIL